VNTFISHLVCLLTKRKAPPKRAGPFPFLKKDEGAHAHTTVSPDTSNQKQPARNSANSRAEFRKAFIEDIRKGTTYDPFSSEIALPKRPPPKKAVAAENDEEKDSTAAVQKTYQPAAKSASNNMSHRDPHRDPHPAGPDTSVMDEADETQEQPNHHQTVRNQEPAPKRGRNDLLQTQAPPPKQREPSSPRREAEYEDEEVEEEEEEVEVPRKRQERQFVSRQQPASKPKNYFRRQEPSANQEEAEEENLFIAELRKEMEDCKRERQRYRQLCADAIREKQSIERLREDAEEQLQNERDEFEAYVENEKKALRKERRQLEEDRRTIRTSQDTEKDEVRKLRREIERLQSALESAQSEAKEKQHHLQLEVNGLKLRLKQADAEKAELMEDLRREQLKRLETREVPYERESKDVTRDSAVDTDRVSRDQARKEHARELEARLKADEEERRAKLQQRQNVQRENKSQPVANSREQVRKEEPPAIPSSAGKRPKTADDLLDHSEPAPAETFPNDVVVTRRDGTDGKVERIYRSEKQEITYGNGTRKVILPSGHVILYFSNGDVKRTFPSGKTTYWYAAAQTTHTQLANGIQIFQFHATNQTERHYPDGRKEIVYPGGDYKLLRSDGTEETDDGEEF
jgi:hypothetical protein